MIQRDFKVVRNDFKVIDGKKQLNKEVLLQTFKDFCNNNITNIDEKRNFDKSAMAVALCYTASGKHLMWNIRVYETLGLNQTNLLKQDDIEEKYLDLYEQKLNQYGLSLNEKITDKEYEELISEDPDYERKRMFIK